MLSVGKLGNSHDLNFPRDTDRSEALAGIARAVVSAQTFVRFERAKSMGSDKSEAAETYNIS
jgi:hypothetical protein